VALANYQNFVALGFNLVALFDQDPHVIGTVVNHVKVEDSKNLKRIVKERNIQIGIIAVPAAFAQGVADELVEAGIQGIWNFAPIKMHVPEGLPIVNEDLSIGLSSLSYYLTRSKLST
jgi:redox-sensing transcriptional repressor